MRLNDDPALVELLAKLESSAPTATIPTGFRGLDELLSGGLRCGHLHVILGEATAGRSTLALGLAREAAFRHGRPALVVAPESDRVEVLTRVVSAESLVPVHHIRRRQLTDVDHERLRRRRKTLASARLGISAGWIHPPGADRIATTIESFDGLEGGMVVVDDLGRRDHQDSQVLSSLRQLARSRHLALVVTAAMPPFGRAGPDTVRVPDPYLDLADVVVLLHRDDLNDPTSTRPGEADLHVIKNRYGPARRLASTIAFQGHYARFTEMSGVART